MNLFMSEKVGHAFPGGPRKRSKGQVGTDCGLVEALMCDDQFPRWTRASCGERIGRRVEEK